MEPGPAFEQKLLRGLGFDSDDQLRRYLRKLCRFFKSLDSAEQRVLLASMPTTKDALRSLQLDVTAQELEDFLRARKGDCAHTILAAHKVHRRAAHKVHRKKDG